MLQLIQLRMPEVSLPARPGPGLNASRLTPIEPPNHPGGVNVRRRASRVHYVNPAGMSPMLHKLTGRRGRAE